MAYSKQAATSIKGKRSERRLGYDRGGRLEHIIARAQRNEMSMLHQTSPPQALITATEPGAYRSRKCLRLLRINTVARRSGAMRSNAAHRALFISQQK